jgi:hypothetical protein
MKPDMEKQSCGKIFLADQRGIMETARYNRYSTFNFEGYFNEHKTPFGSLRAVNEVTVAGLQQVELVVEESSYVVILPITGQVHAMEMGAVATSLNVGEILVHPVAAQGKLILVNPYKSEEITFLELLIKTNESIDLGNLQVATIDLATIENQLFPVVRLNSNSANPFIINLGRFDGRREASYTLISQQSTLFAFVISGAFELEGRLLHEKDGLALWNTSEVELEALSNHAIIVTIELLNEQNL